MHDEVLRSTVTETLSTPPPRVVRVGNDEVEAKALRRTGEIGCSRECLTNFRIAM